MYINRFRFNFSSYRKVGSKVVSWKCGYLNRRKQCCLNQSDVNPVTLQPMPQMMAPRAQAQAQLQLMPSAPPAIMPPTSPQADVENQLAMIRAQQDVQLAMIRQQLSKEPAVDANQQAIMAAKENRYPVV